MKLSIKGSRPGSRLKHFLQIWPLIAEKAGFDENCPPNFLILETVQYFMSRVVDPLMEEGAFAGLSVLERRLYSQLIDNLNKAFLVGFPPLEIAPRLKGAWIGSEGRESLFDDVQRAADQYLEMCRQDNLLDFGLQLTVFREHLLTETACRDYLENTYRHLIADNVEEDVPVTHDILLDWIPEFDSALVIFDEGGAGTGNFSAPIQSRPVVSKIAVTTTGSGRSFLSPWCLLLLLIRWNHFDPAGLRRFIQLC